MHGERRNRQRVTHDTIMTATAYQSQGQRCIRAPWRWREQETRLRTRGGQLCDCVSERGGRRRGTEAGEWVTGREVKKSRLNEWVGEKRWRRRSSMCLQLNEQHRSKHNILHHPDSTYLCFMSDIHPLESSNSTHIYIWAQNTSLCNCYWLVLTTSPSGKYYQANELICI